MARKTGKPYLRREQAKRRPVHHLRQWREYKGWTQARVAEVTGYSIAAVSAYETGRDAPSMEALAVFARAFGQPIGTLIDVDPFQVYAAAPKRR